MDFAVLGNDRATLEWLTQMLEAAPNVRLLDRAPLSQSPDDSTTTGVVVLGLQQASGAASAQATRLAFVMQDPVELLSDGDEPDGRLGAPGGYALALNPQLAALGDRALVIGADEIASSRERLAELFAHLGITPGGTPLRTESTPARSSVAPGRRALLFSMVRSDVEELERAAGRTFRSWRFGGPGPAGPPAQPSGRSLVYVGRRRDIEAPPDSLLMTDWDALPVRIAPILNRADSLTILDPMSFPFDALRDSDRGIPLAVELPDLEPEVLAQLLGTPLLRHITPFDAVATTSEEAWSALRARYSWPHFIRIAPTAAVSAGMDLAGDPSGCLRARKSGHLVLAKALGVQLEAARAAVPAGELLTALILAKDIGRWASLFQLGQTDVKGIDREPESVARAALGFPEWSFDTKLSWEDEEPERAHVTFAVAALCQHSRDVRRETLSRLVRALRIGGRLIVLDRFLADGHVRDVGAPRPRELVADVWHASARHVVLEHVEALRLPNEDLTSVGVLAFTKLGRPERL